MPIIRKALQNPCCDENMTKYRLNDDGTVDVSTDGGATYHDLPDDGNPLDPEVFFPPITGEDAFTIRCKAANSVTGWYKLLYQQYEDALVAEVNELALAAILTGVLLLVGIGIFSVWAAIGTTLALIVARKNAEDFAAEFTDEFWHKLCERAYCDVDAAGVYINSDPAQIISEVTSAIPGYAAEWLNAGMRTLNGRDLTNIAASGFDAGIDCTDFDCGCEEVDRYIITGGFVGSGVDEDGNCYIDVSSEPHGGGSHETATIGFGSPTPNPSGCALWVNHTIVAGTPSFVNLYAVTCPYDGFYNGGIGHGSCVSAIDAESDAGQTFTMRFTFTNC